MKRFSTEASLKPLVAQFVPIKLDVASDDYKIWRRDHKPEKGAIPQMYIVRADGEELFNKVGGLPTEQLETVLSQSLKNAGYILSDGEAAKVQATVTETSKLIESGDLSAAVKAISQMRGATDTSVVCFAKPVIELRSNVKTLVEKAGQEIDTVIEDVTAFDSSNRETSIRLAGRIADLNQSWSQFKPVSRQIISLNRAAKKDRELASVVADVKKFRSLKNARTASVTKLSELASKYENTSLGREIAVVLSNAKKIGPSGSTTGFAKAEVRTWTSKGGSFSIDAKPISIAANKIKLETTNGKVIDVRIASLSQDDQDWIKDNQ